MYSKLTDEELMLAYQKGEYEAFKVLYLRRKDKVYGFLKKRLVKEDDVNEVFQNIFLKLHRKKHLYDSKYLFIKWLYTLSRSELLDYVKKGKKDMISLTDELYESKIIPDQQTVDQDLSLDINDIQVNLKKVKSLNNNEREALYRKFYSEEDYDEISRALGVSKVSARKIVSRGIEKLRLKLIKGQRNG